MLGHGPVFWAEIARLETPGERGVPFKFLDEGQVENFYFNTNPIKEEGAMPKLLRRYPHLHCDLSDPTAYNALTRDEKYTAEFVKEFEDRLYFGTDCCFPNMPVPLIDTLKKWKKDGVISSAAYNKITHENAMKLLGI